MPGTMLWILKGRFYFYTILKIGKLYGVKKTAWPSRRAITSTHLISQNTFCWVIYIYLILTTIMQGKTGYNIISQRINLAQWDSNAYIINRARIQTRYFSLQNLCSSCYTTLPPLHMASVLHSSQSIWMGIFYCYTLLIRLNFTLSHVI